MSKLVIVESPAKASKIASYLGPGYIVKSSIGHVRDLPTSAAQVPAKYKGLPWARTGVNVEDGFAPLYVVNPDKRSVMKELREALAKADELYLATDEDREGEAIAWHLLQELKPKVPVKRMVFHEITPGAIKEAVAKPRDLDLDLVDAQETRRILDRLYGYEVSPVLWKKVLPKLSAGRVQSVATRLVVDRERERIAFVEAGYCDIEAQLAVRESEAKPGQPTSFTAKLVTLGPSRIAQGRDFDAQGKLKTKVALVLDEADAQTLAAGLHEADFTVAGVESKPSTRRPAAPFRTTTLQQEAGRKLGFTTARTMSVAQDLYESGHITYMRTDSVTLSHQAIEAARRQIASLYGLEYLPDRPRLYDSKVKNAQEAHEAIRPAGDDCRTPSQTGLRGDQLRLYELIWQRTLASQMVDAKALTVTVAVDAVLASKLALKLGPVSKAGFTASGTTFTFQGFRMAYIESVGDEADESTAVLPELAVGQVLDAEELNAQTHTTRPPARYTEPSLVAKLEELEIGRPSTYASIIRTITSRDYVFKRGTSLVPTWLAFAVTGLLEDHFTDLVDYTFTANLEDKLDEIADGKAKRLEVLTQFYFGDPASPAKTSAGLHTLVDNLGDIDARATSTFPIGDSGIDARVGRFGVYLERHQVGGHDESADQTRANVPPDWAPDELTPDKARELLAKVQDAGEASGRVLGDDPETGWSVVAKDGRYGPYVTLVAPEPADDDGDRKPSKKAKSAPKPPTASLFKSMSLDTVSLEEALSLLSLPRTIGVDDDGQVIVAANGRYGPYLKKGVADFRSLGTEEQLFIIDLDEAKALFAQPKQRRGATAKASAGRSLGEDPNSGKPILVRDGRFGPYVSDGETNATLRRVDDPETITIDRAVELLAEKRAKGPAPKRVAKRAKSK